MRWPNIDSTPKPVTLPCNKLWYVTRSRVPSTLSRYGVTIRVNVTSVYPPLRFCDSFIAHIYPAISTNDTVWPRALRHDNKIYKTNHHITRIVETNIWGLRRQAMSNNTCLYGEALPLLTVLFFCNHFMKQRNIASRRFCCLVTITKKKEIPQPNLPPHPKLKFLNQSQYICNILLCRYSHNRRQCTLLVI